MEHPRSTNLPLKSQIPILIPASSRHLGSKFVKVSKCIIYNPALVTLLKHIKVLLTDLDPIKELPVDFPNSQELLAGNWDVLEDEKHGNLNVHYLFPTLFTLFITLDCLLVFHQNNWKYSYKGMPEFLFHSIFPYEFWQQGDMLMVMCLAMLLIILLCLLFDPMLDKQFVMFIFRDSVTNQASILTNGGIMRPEETVKLVAFRRKAKLINEANMGLIWALVEAFYMGNFLLNWTNSPRDYLMSVANFIYWTYAVIVNIFMAFHFAISTSYFRIKQNCKLARINRLLILIEEKQKRQIHRKSWSNVSLLNQFKGLEREILQLFREIRSQNAFWSKYLTIYFISYINDVSYLAYSFFFVKSDLGWKKYFFLFFSFQFMVSLVLITVECSRIVAKNCRLHRQSQRVTLKLQTVYPFRLRELLKIDQLAMNYKNIPRISFKLLNNYRIDSKFFQMLFSYTSLYFMMIFREQQHIVNSAKNSKKL